MKRGDRLAVCTTVYPGCERFLKDWFASVQSQTDQDFDLWIASDGFDSSALQDIVDRHRAAYVVEREAADTPARLRSRFFGRVLEHADVVVLTDSDDILESTRVAAARTMIGEADVIGCSLRLIREDGSDLGIVFGSGSIGDWREELARYNVFGLSNSSYRADALRQCLPIPDEAVLIDWYLITVCVEAEARILFDLTPRMRYRQYVGNTASVVPPFSAETVERSTERVLGHYDLVLHSGRLLADRTRTRLLDAQTRVTAFRASFQSDSRIRSEYLSRLNAMTPRYVWWWCVANPNLESLWMR